ncbi:MAG: MFS transporter [Akkermansiaceae bacterium]
MKTARGKFLHDADLENGVWKKTFIWDLFRALPMGVTETVGSTFGLLIAIRYLDVATLSKSYFMAGPALGMLLSLFSVAMVRRLGWSVNVSAALTWVISSVGFGVAAMGHENVVCYIIGVVVALLAHSISSPLLPQIYRRHYPGEIRGKLFSFVGMVRAGTAAGFAFFAGMWLAEGRIGYEVLLWVFSGCSLLKAFFTMMIQPVYLRRSHKLNVLDAFGHLKTDLVFRKLISTWMLLGIGNLLCMALFVEYVTNDYYGFGFNEGEISMVTTTVPMLAFIVSVVGWGMVYDKMEFYRLRILVNLFFIAGVLMFFFAPSYVWLCVGMAFHGMGKAGGNVLWSLWTTKFAPADKVGEYMSVHTFMTGFRGIISAFVAFPLILIVGPHVIGMIGAGLMVISSLWLLPEVRRNWGKG